MRGSQELKFPRAPSGRSNSVSAALLITLLVESEMVEVAELRG